MRHLYFQQLDQLQREIAILDEDSRCVEERINEHRRKYPYLPVSLVNTQLSLFVDQ